MGADPDITSLGFLSCFVFPLPGFVPESKASRRNPVTRGQAVAVCIQRDCDVL